MGILNIFIKGAENRKLIKNSKVFINNRRYDEAIEDLSKVLSVSKNNYNALIARARAYCYIEEYEKALVDLNRAIYINPLCSSGHFYRGQVNVIQNNLYEAIEDFNKVIKMEKRNFVAYLKRGSIYSKLGMYDAAVNNFKALIRIKKRDSRYYDLLLSACLAGKRFKDIDKYATKLVNQHDESPRGYYYLGRMHAEKDNNQKAVECFSDALRRGGNNLEYRYHRGMSYVYLGEHDKAIVDFTLAIGLLNEGGGEFYFSRGYSYLKLKEFENAINDFDKCIEVKHNLESSYYNKAAAYINIKDYKSAVDTLNILLEGDKSFEGAYYDRAFCYKNLEEYNKAISDYQRAIELNPKVEAFYYELARLYFDINEFDKVIEVLDNAEKNTEKWSYKSFSYTLKGDIYFNEKNDNSTAIANYTKSIEISPTPYTYTQRGKVYNDNKLYPKALEDFNKAIKMKPENNNAEVYINRGEALKNLNMYDDAIKDYKKASLINKGYVSLAYYNIGVILSLKGKPKQAIYYYSKSLENDSSNYITYFKRGEALSELGELDRAIGDMESASLKLDKKHSDYNENKENILKTLDKISKKTISEQSAKKIAELLSCLEK